jgi:allantoinase
MKSGDFVAAWGGIAGVQSTLAVLLDLGYHDRKLPLARIAALLASAPAQRFRIPGKGSLSAGQDADLALVDLAASFTLEASDLHQRHKISPYLGKSFRGQVRRTVRRGETIFLDGQITARTNGKLIRPAYARLGELRPGKPATLVSP